MVIKSEMYSCGGYKKMGFSHHEEEKMYTESYGGSRMQMMRPNPCISTPQPPHGHLFAGSTPHPSHGHHFAGAGNCHQGHQHGHSGYYNKNAHGQHGHNGYGNGRMPQETMMFSRDRMMSGGHGGHGSHETHYATSHVAMSPHMHTHHFDLKNLDD